MVKANGYGLGAVEVARALERVDPWGFGVASLDEGAALRAAGITRPILVMTPLLPQRIDAYLELDLRPPIGDPAALDAWTGRGARPFHVEIDTGMSRAGVRGTIVPASAAFAGAARDAAKGWEGAFTHFLAAESRSRAPTAGQWDRFQEVAAALPRRPGAGPRGQQRRGTSGKGFAGDLVRPGIFLYGGAAGKPAPPGRGPAGPCGRGPLHRCRATRSGMAPTWRAERPGVSRDPRPIGYADGFPRSARPGPGRASREIELHGKLVPMVGRVTMDMCMAAVDCEVSVGDMATVFGGLISLDQQAEAAGTISYELLTRLGPRVARCYGRNP